MPNSFSLIHRCFYEKKLIPNGLISYWKNRYDEKGILKCPPFSIRLCRQVALDDANNYEILLINSYNIWNCNNKYMNQQLIANFKSYKQILKDKYYLNLAFNYGNLIYLPKDIVLVHIYNFI